MDPSPLKRRKVEDGEDRILAKCEKAADTVEIVDLSPMPLLTDEAGPSTSTNVQASQSQEQLQPQMDLKLRVRLL